MIFTETKLKGAFINDIEEHAMRSHKEATKK